MLPTMSYVVGKLLPVYRYTGRVYARCMFHKSALKLTTDDLVMTHSQHHKQTLHCSRCVPPVRKSRMEIAHWVTRTYNSSAQCVRKSGYKLQFKVKHSRQSKSQQTTEPSSNPIGTQYITDTTNNELRN